MARIYDPLAKLFYGNSIAFSQVCFLNVIARDSSVLILGGGTGWIITEILHAQPQCSIWYVEASAEMIERARMRHPNHRGIHFIHGTEDNIPDRKFDVIITHFYLDLFDETRLRVIIRNLLTYTKSNSMWLAADFVNDGKWWQSTLLWSMYVFFRWTCGVEARRLPRWRKCLLGFGMISVDQRSFFRGFIGSNLYAVPLNG